MNNSKEPTEAFHIHNITKFPSITGDSIHLKEKDKDADKGKFIERTLEETPQWPKRSEQELEIFDTSETVSIASDFKSKDPSTHSVTQDDFGQEASTLDLLTKEAINKNDYQDDTQQNEETSELSPNKPVQDLFYVEVSPEEFIVRDISNVKVEVNYMLEPKEDLVPVEQYELLEPMEKKESLQVAVEAITNNIAIPSGSTVSLTQEIKDDLQPLPNVLLSEETDEQRNRFEDEEQQETRLQKPKGKCGKLFNCFFFRRRRSKVLHDCGQYH